MVKLRYGRIQNFQFLRKNVQLITTTPKLVTSILRGNLLSAKLKNVQFITTTPKLVTSVLCRQLTAFQIEKRSVSYNNTEISYIIINRQQTICQIEKRSVNYNNTEINYINIMQTTYCMLDRKTFIFLQQYLNKVTPLQRELRSSERREVNLSGRVIVKQSAAAKTPVNSEILK